MTSEKNKASPTATCEQSDYGTTSPQVDHVFQQLASYRYMYFQFFHLDVLGQLGRDWVKVDVVSVNRYFHRRRHVQSIYLPESCYFLVLFCLFCFFFVEDQSNPALKLPSQGL